MVWLCDVGGDGVMLVVMVWLCDVGGNGDGVVL